MPEIGEIRRANEIGFKGHNKWIWSACIDCGKKRWLQMKGGIPESPRCQSCANKLRLEGKRGCRGIGWKGGRYKDGDGYIGIMLQPGDFFFSMANKKRYVKEHRLVMARKLGRCLQPWELVHHKGIRYTDIRNRSDNLEDNLEVTIRGTHTRDHSRGYRDGYTKGLIDGRDKQIQELRQEIRLVRLQISQTQGIINNA